MRTYNVETKHWILIAAAILVLLALLIWIAPLVPPGIDWHNAFRPAALELLAGRSPYTADGYFNPPWALLPLIPFALLPEEIGRIFLVIVGLGVFAYIAKKMGASGIAMIALLLSPLVLHGTLNGNIDWLAALGVIFPPWLGLFFVVIKPQLGFGIVVFWLFTSWKEGGIKNVIKTFAPVTIAYLFSFVLFGLWPLTASQAANLAWNASFWPVSIPLGLAALVTALRKNDIRYAMIASPSLSPYVAFHSWIIVLLAILRSTPETVAAVIGLWVLVIIRTFGG